MSSFWFVAVCDFFTSAEVKLESGIGALNLFVGRYSYFGDKCTYHVGVKCNIDDKIIIFSPYSRANATKTEKSSELEV